MTVETGTRNGLCARSASGVGIASCLPPFVDLKGICARFGAIALCLAMAGCASTAHVVAPDGTVTDVRAGFGNTLEQGPITVKPSKDVVDAGERVSNHMVDRASDALIKEVTGSTVKAANSSAD